MNDINYYMDKVNKKGLDGGVHRTKVYPFFEDGVILVNKREKNFLNLQSVINKCNELGVNIPKYLEYREDGNQAWILEELAPGKEFATLVNCENGVDVLESIPYQHLEKYIRDVFTLGDNGIGVEPRRRNIFYDSNVGFTTIDVALLSDNKRACSLDEVNYFFIMFYPVFVIDFGDDQRGKSIKRKITLNVIKAFENGHPYFKKYSRWIYRNNDYISNLLKDNGIDLSLSESEILDLYSYIEELINLVINRSLNNEDMFYCLYSYTDLLSSSIALIPDFELFDIKNVTLEKYIRSVSYDRLKQMFFDNPDDTNLKEIYFKIRKRELDPINIYSVEYIYEMINEELSELLNNKIL